jgi:hypothetical protein
MADALTPPLLVAAAVLAIAGLAKLRAPNGAVRALRSLGMPASPLLVLAFALGEVVFAAWALIHPSRVVVAALAAAYASFALITGALARRNASCGCFGAASPPASAAQASISAVFGAVALAATVPSVHGIGWLLDRSTWSAIVLIAATAGSAYGAVVAYTEIPSAWSAWSGR